MRALLMAGVAGISLCIGTNAQAQDVPAKAPESTGGLSDIVVTARRSAESLQNVPVAVTALSADFIERQNISDASDLPQFGLDAPQLRITLSYNIPQDVQAKGQYALDSFPEENHNPFSDHNDFINVNSAQTMQRIAGCINKGKNCV